MAQRSGRIRLTVVNQGWTQVKTALEGDPFSSGTVCVRAHDIRREAVGNGRDEDVDRLVVAGHCRVLVGG